MFQTHRGLRQFLLAFSALTLLGTGCYAQDAAPVEEKKPSVSTYDMLNLFGDVFERVRRDYVEEVEDQKLIESAINGMLTSLDPHSGYLNEKSFQEMQVQTKGEFGGLGIEVTMENGLVKVVSPIDGTPAFHAGVQSGDLITQIDGEQVMGLTLSEAVDKMRGKVGTSIKISAIREGVSEPLEFTITRDLIKIQSVRARAENDVAYIRVVSFSETTYDSLERDLAAQKKEIGDKLKGIVIDLRNNPGGLLDQAIAVSDAFLERGEIVSTRERDPANTKRYSARKGDIAEGLPIVILINQGSASASEIVAGALKDHKRAIVLGTKSFGKGSVQTVIPLKDHGAMRLTTARYYTPSGVSIQATGIEPDIIVEAAKVEPLEAGDSLRSEASLRGHLTNDQLKKELERREAEKSNTADEEKAKPIPLRDLTADQDYQLSRALDLIRALSIYKQVLNEEAS